VVKQPTQKPILLKHIDEKKMPAVELTSLNTRIQSLQLYRNDPRVYLTKLEDLLALYASDKVKQGENVPIKTLLPQMHIPDLVLQKIIDTFPTLANTMPDNALVIMDTLWGRAQLEYKILAIHLLADLPASHSDEISKRLPQWTITTDDVILHNVILDQLTKFDIVNSTPIRPFIEEMLHAETLDLRRMAYAALANMIQQNSFTDLPWAFNLVTPILCNASLNIYRELNLIFDAFIQKSEVETTAYLAELYIQSGSEKAKKYIRKIIPRFSSDNQTFLINITQQN